MLSLVEDGVLDLNGPVDALLPELADRRVLRRPNGPIEQTVPAQRPITVREDGSYTWEGGLGTTWSNVPSEDLTVVVLTQRGAHEQGMPAVCDEVMAAARSTRATRPT